MNGASFDGGTREYLVSIDPEAEAALFAVERPRESTGEEVHLPRLFVPEVCIEKCGGLAIKAAGALFKNTLNGDEQNDVFCLKPSRRACNGFQHLSGTYSTSGKGWGIEGTNELFVLNPSEYYRKRISKAAEQDSAPHHISELKQP